MCAKMHDHEIDIHEDLVGRLLAGQFPQWAALPIKRVESSGTDNAIYRLGEELAVRLPRIEEATGQAEWELRWLPWLAPLLPLAIPAPVVLGLPAEGYPWTWAGYRWLPGEMARLDGIVDHSQAATALGEFVTALHAVGTAGGPAPATSGRGGSLVLRTPMCARPLPRLLS